MRRVALLSSLFAIGLVSLGCKHVSGKCDCTHDPANHAMPPIAAPYPQVGPTVGSPGAGVPATLPAEVMPAPMTNPMPAPMKIPMGK
jgi:hypothetical protein